MTYHCFFLQRLISLLIAAQALSGVFLAEQIRQQQLAAALESRLDSNSFSAMQTALLMNKLKTGAAVAETSKLLAAAAAASTPTTSTSATVEKSRGRGRGRGSRKNGNAAAAAAATLSYRSKATVASMLAKTRESERPELTIEPIFRTSVDEDRFDTSDNGRRFDSVMGEDGKLKIKTVSDSPEIRNLSDDEDEDSAADGTTAALAAAKLLELSQAVTTTVVSADAATPANTPSNTSTSSSSMSLAVICLVSRFFFSF